MITLLLLFQLVLIHAQEIAYSFSLEEAISYAMSNNYTVRLADLDIDEAEERKSQKASTREISQYAFKRKEAGYSERRITDNKAPIILDFLDGNIDNRHIDNVRALQKENWVSETLKNQVEDLLKIRDEMVVRLMSHKGNDPSCDCGDDHK